MAVQATALSRLGAPTPQVARRRDRKYLLSASATTTLAVACAGSEASSIIVDPLPVADDPVDGVFGERDHLDPFAAVRQADVGAVLRDALLDQRLVVLRSAVHPQGH